MINLIIFNKRNKKNLLRLHFKIIIIYNFKSNKKIKKMIKNYFKISKISINPILRLNNL